MHPATVTLCVAIAVGLGTFGLIRAGGYILRRLGNRFANAINDHHDACRCRRELQHRLDERAERGGGADGRDRGAAEDRDH